MPQIVGKNTPKNGVAPAIALCNPKGPDNVGMIVRLASCYGIQQVWWTGNRVHTEMEQRKRLPREERMKGYNDVEMVHYDYFFDMFEDCTPVAIEVREDAEMLHDFDHPENALYVFGPEDGSIDKVTMRHCHRRIVIPTRHCLNLATAVSTVLWDRQLKQHWNGQTVHVTPGEWEDRGPIVT